MCNIFEHVLLKLELLIVAIENIVKVGGISKLTVADFEMNSYRKAAYRQYILWKYGKLDKGNRRVCPSCVVRLVRQTDPAPDGQYMGFRRH